MVRLVDHHELDAPGVGERIGMPCQELGRGQRDVHAAVGQARERLTALVDRGLAGERDHGDAEERQRLAQMERLVGDERT